MKRDIGTSVHCPVESVAIIGSGNWGSTIAKIVGHNVAKSARGVFDDVVRMWVYEEEVERIDGRVEMLSEIINTEHVNVKYLPEIRLPLNVVAVTDLVECVKDATLLVFVIPHQFVHKICTALQGRLNAKARGISLIKGIDSNPECGGELRLISQMIKGQLGIDMCVLMGANIANEVARGFFCEATIGYADARNAALWESLFATKTFRIACVPDLFSVEICGALKNIVAIASGFVDGLGLGDNTKAAIIRIGLCEMIDFAKRFYANVKDATFFESCGIADLITTCQGGRNRKIAEAFVRQKKPIEVLEKEMLKGQLLQGPLTSKEVYFLLKKKNLLKQFPLFVAVYRICYEGVPVEDFYLRL